MVIAPCLFFWDMLERRLNVSIFVVGVAVGGAPPPVAVHRNFTFLSWLGQNHNRTSGNVKYETQTYLRTCAHTCMYGCEARNSMALGMSASYCSERKKIEKHGAGARPKTKAAKPPENTPALTRRRPTDREERK